MSLLSRCRLSRLNLGAASFLLLAMFSISSFAGVIYEYREVGSPKVIGTLEFDPSGLDALFLDNAVFGLGSDNLLSVGGEVTGFIYIIFPTIFPVVPTDPIIDKTLVIEFRPSPGEDFIGLATYFYYPDGSIRIGDLFIYGDWVPRVVPEPGTLALLALGLAGLGFARRRR